MRFASQRYTSARDHRWPLVQVAILRTEVAHRRATKAISVAAYIEQLGNHASKPTVKQYLAAIRKLFDHLVSGGIVEVNLAAAVRGRKYAVRRGKTPVLTAAEARQLLDSIESNTLIGLRDRALVGTMVYASPAWVRR